eukprot:6214549-Pleurochrysis_carterae.AAC.1
MMTQLAGLSMALAGLSMARVYSQCGCDGCLIEPRSSDLLKPKQAYLIDVVGIHAAKASLARRDQRGRNEPGSSDLTRPERAWLVGLKAAEASLARRIERGQGKFSSK